MNKLCPRCSREIAATELNCADFPYCLKYAKPPEEPLNANQSTPSNKKDNTLGNELVAILFYAVLLLITYGLIVNISRNGLLVAIKTSPGTLTTYLILSILWVVGSKDKLNKSGFGFIYKSVKYLIIGIAAIAAISILFALFPGINSSGLADNIRH